MYTIGQRGNRTQLLSQMHGKLRKKQWSGGWSSGYVLGLAPQTKRYWILLLLTEHHSAPGTHVAEPTILFEGKLLALFLDVCHLEMQELLPVLRVAPFNCLIVHSALSTSCSLHHLPVLVSICCFIYGSIPLTTDYCCTEFDGMGFSHFYHIGLNAIVAHQNLK